MSLATMITKLKAARDAFDALLEEFDDTPPELSEAEEPEILLSRSARNRRSEKNTVMTMVPLNGAPSVPESWKSYAKNPRTVKWRAWLYQVLQQYEPMTRAELCALANEAGIRRRGSKQSANAWHAFLHGMFKAGRLKTKKGLVVLGKE